MDKKLQKRIIAWRKELKGHERAMHKQAQIYNSIMKAARKDGFAKDPLFQAAYCYFYDIKIWKNDYVLTEWINRYFDVMGRTSKIGIEQHEIESIVGFVIVEGATEKHLSYATKLMHTCNPRIPIYDSNVWRALRGSLEGKTSIEQYRNLDLNQYLKENEKVQAAVKAFGKEYGVSNHIKALDFLLWRIGKNLKRR